jgi:predicted nucleotidyltransferase
VYPLEVVTDLRDPSHDRLRAALAGGPPLRLAVLFGSRATGRARAGSDFDVGIGAFAQAVAAFLRQQPPGA